MLRRTPLKRGNSQLKRTPLKRVGKGKLKKQERGEAIDKKQRQIDDWNFYTEIWNERPHHCEETNRPLGYEPLTTMFHHILPKEDYPQYRHCKWNIALLHPEVHDQAEMDLDKTPKTKERYLELLNQHG